MQIWKGYLQDKIVQYVNCTKFLILYHFQVSPFQYPMTILLWHHATNSTLRAVKAVNRDYEMRDSRLSNEKTNKRLPDHLVLYPETFFRANKF